MIDRENGLPIVRQCEVLELSRSAVYSQARPVSAADLALTRRLDELRLAHSFLGARKLASMLKRAELAVDRRHVKTLQCRMGLVRSFRFYNGRRPHQELDDRKPDETYLAINEMGPAA